MKKLLLKFTVLIIIAASFFAVKHYGIMDFLNLDYLKSNQARFQEFYHQNMFQTLAVYIGIYISITALSLPGGATVLTLAGGALFGFWVGLVAISFASTIGATLAFLTARFLLRDFIQNKFHEQLKRFNQGIEKDGAFYLFTLRIAPIFPFFLINLVMGLTPIRTGTFFFVSQAGMLLGTAVYVNAGRQISQIDSIKGILSLELIISFSILGILPFIARKVVKIINHNS